MIGNGPEVTTFPHSRHDCLLHPVQGKNKTFKMKNFCNNCFCFVCDVKVGECTHWKDHCVAVNNNYWQGERKRMQIQKRLGKDGLGNMCLRCEGTGTNSQSYSNRCYQCLGTGFLVQCPFQNGSKVTCKTHLGVIPKNFVAVVTGVDKRVVQSEDGEDITMEFPRLRFHHYSNNVYISVRNKDELKRIVSAPQNCSSLNAGWPVGCGQFKNGARIQLKIQKDLNFSSGSTFKKDWVAQFDGHLNKLSWRRREIGTNGDRINSSSGDYVWHLQTQMHVPHGVRLINGGYSNRVNFQFRLIW